jgi:hypothetical protein
MQQNDLFNANNSIQRTQRTQRQTQFKESKTSHFGQKLNSNAKCEERKKNTALWPKTIEELNGALARAATKREPHSRRKR